ncbi:unnamed protein product [Closterium sp. Yama58-4]|nr:unnamed protein product [Closterium sp. Yama58-4]
MVRRERVAANSRRLDRIAMTRLDGIATRISFFSGNGERAQRLRRTARIAVRQHLQIARNGATDPPAAAKSSASQHLASPLSRLGACNTGGGGKMRSLLLVALDVTSFVIMWVWDCGYFLFL